MRVSPTGLILFYYLKLVRLVCVFHHTDWYFSWVCTITVVMKYLAGHIEALAELHKLVETLGFQFVPLYK